MTLEALLHYIYIHICIYFFIDILDAFKVPMYQQTLAAPTASASTSFKRTLEGVYLYKAYEDKRLKGTSYIRILAIVKDKVYHLIKKRLCCSIRNSDGETTSTKVESQMIWNNFASHNIYLLSCQVKSTSTPLSVEILDHNCTANIRCTELNQPECSLSVIPSNFNQRSESVAVCVKVAYGDLDLLKLIEWIEINKLLGIEKIYIYDSNIRLKINRTNIENQIFLNFMNHYKDMVVVKQHDAEIQKMSRNVFNDSFPIQNKDRKNLFITNNLRQNWVLENLSLNDCLYTASEKILLIIDLDEILMVPEGILNLSDRFFNSNSTERPPGGLGFDSAVFSDDIPIEQNTISEQSSLYYISHNRRTKVTTDSPKSLINTDRCVSLSQHWCTGTIEDYNNETKEKWRIVKQNNSRQLNETLGFVRHHRIKCRLRPGKCKKEMSNIITDNSLKQYYQVINRLFNSTLKQLAIQL